MSLKMLRERKRERERERERESLLKAYPLGQGLN